MAYTINYTNTSKGTITVEDSTINTSTSLRIPGRNSTAYGAVIAENFLHLLENFANNTEPSNPSEGQLWFDTTVPAQLKIYNGSNWIPASGVARSDNTPVIAEDGDLWVDTNNQQLYLWSGSGWILVGPEFSEGLATGARADQIVGQDNNLYTILRIEVDGTTVGIISGNNTPFVPKSTIAGFAQISPGFNVISRDINNDGLSDFKFFGTAEKAESLVVNNEIIAAGNFLRGDTTSTSAFPLNIQNNQGISYGVNAEMSIGVEGQAGIIQHNIGGSNIDVRVRNNNLSKTVIRVDSNLRVGINTEAPEEALDVVGNIQSSGDLTVNGTTQSTTINNGALVVRGGSAIKQNLNVGGDTSLTGLLTTTNAVPNDNNIYDIGTSQNKYRSMYATTFVGNLQGNVSGTITGRATEANKISSRTTFIMEGDVSTVVPIEFDGTFQDPNFDNGDDPNGNPLPVGEQPLQKKFRTEIDNGFISQKPALPDVLNEDLILFQTFAGSSPGLKSATKENFLKSIPKTPAGIILPFGGELAPTGWILCDGRILDSNNYPELFRAIGYRFKSLSQLEDLGFSSDFFAVPDLRGRLPLGADNMGGTSANIVTAGSADNIGSIDGSETKLIDISQIPDHLHDLQDADNNQFYVYQDRQDPTTDSNVEQVQGPSAEDTSQRLDNSGGIKDRGISPQSPFNVMPPTLTLSYIIYGGERE